MNEVIYPTLRAIIELGGEARNSEIDERVFENGNYPDEVLAVTTPSNDKSAFNHRIGWCRTYLKKMGAIDNKVQGVWTVEKLGYSLTEEEVIKLWLAKLDEGKQKRQERKEVKLDEQSDLSSEDHILGGEYPSEGLSESEGISEREINEVLLEKILELSPDAFEHLAKRLLRRLKFEDVEVTGRSGDGGIDGVGLYKPSDLISFQVCFQCKRYSPHNIVPSKEIRDLRGAIAGRGDRGIFITTSGFTRGAREEANRDGAPPIELVNGTRLCELMIGNDLGVDSKTIKVYEINQDFFDSLT